MKYLEWKTMRTGLLTCLIGIALTSTGCDIFGGGDDEGDSGGNSEFVGTWEVYSIMASGAPGEELLEGSDDQLLFTFQDNGNVQMQANLEGTDDTVQDGTWRTSGGRVIMDFASLSDNVEANYSFDNGDLVLTFSANDLLTIVLASFDASELPLEDLGITEQELQALVAQIGNITMRLDKTS